MNITEIKLNNKNPRYIKDDKFELLKKSISEFPKMMELRPIIIDDNNIILAGNMRFRALKELKFKDIPKNWIKKASELTEDEKKRFIITDNNSFGSWDMDILANEWDLKELKQWGTDLPDFNNDEIENIEIDLSEKINNQLRIEIICENEQIQQNLYSEFLQRGLQCKILTL